MNYLEDFKAALFSVGLTDQDIASVRPKSVEAARIALLIQEGMNAVTEATWKHLNLAAMVNLVASAAQRWSKAHLRHTKNQIRLVAPEESKAIIAESPLDCVSQNELEIVRAQGSLITAFIKLLGDEFECQRVSRFSIIVSFKKEIILGQYRRKAYAGW